MKQTKRLFAVLLAVVMLLGVVPVMQFSANALSPTYSVSAGYASSSYYTNLCNVVLTGNQRRDIVAVAQSQLGYHEGNNSSQLSGNYNGSGNYTEYGYWYGLQDEWCAMFVSWCARQANIPTSILKNSTCAGVGESNFNLSYEDGASYTPKQGDLFFTKGWTHVGLVASVSGSTFTTIEGNSSNSVASNTYSISNYYFGVPDYTGDANTFADLGEQFYALILNTKYWKPISLNTSTNKITLETEKNVPYQKWRFTQQSDGAYLIESCANGKALEMTNGDCVAKTQLTAHDDWWGGHYQQWYLIPRGDGFIFKSKHYTGENWVMDLRGSSNADGSVIQIYPRNDDYADDETWSVYKIDDYATSSNVKTDKSIYPLGSDVKITWNYCVGASSYRLVIYKAGESGQLLSTSIDKSTTSYTFRPTEDGGYTFRLKGVGAEEESSVCRIIVNPQAVNLGEDFFAEIVNTSTGRVIGNYDNNVQASSNEENDPRLIWHFMQNSDGSYLAYNTYNSALLTAENAGTSNGDNIICKTRYEGASQHWVVTQKNGVDCLVSSSNNRLMSLKGASPEPGTNVYLWTDNGPNGTAAQGFTVVKKTDYARPDAPDAPELSIGSLGSQDTDTVFTWTASPLKSEKYDRRTYNLRIWQGSELGVNGTEYMHVFDLTDTTCNVRLPMGVYTAYLTASNTKYHWFSTESNPITFTIGNHSHNWQLNETTAATCIATGTKTFTCACGASYTETIPVNSSNHVNKTNVAATASTCTVHGYTAGVYCNDCERYVSGHEAQPLAAHTLTTINQIVATCTAEGYTGDQYCTTCKQTISTGTTIAKKAHTLTTINQRAATCTAEGYTGDQVCTVCKQTISKGTAIAKKAHTLTTVNQKNAGCTTAGYTGDQYCTTCKQTITKGSAVNALGHTSPDGNGNCTRCGQHIKDVTPSNPQPNPNACKYCGKVHTGPFGWLIKFFHSILAIFKR